MSNPREKKKWEFGNLITFPVCSRHLLFVYLLSLMSRKEQGVQKLPAIMNLAPIALTDKGQSHHNLHFSWALLALEKAVIVSFPSQFSV